MNSLKIGIMPQQQIRARTLAIASGKYLPQLDEPKIWFGSIRSLAEVLSDENQALLVVIKEQKPTSIRQLAEITGRQSSNLSRTLKAQRATKNQPNFKSQTKKRPSNGAVFLFDLKDYP